ncbi:hypothetical protein AMAG_01344 [Allomyces macrogynus ATCC 38327]|uniref:RRM domain-containing protein n=1 Tax=Allomyces macrogynus (strain ATCC 38327) TaxID=578462 RepID=A0A0L0RYJ0_ALLM3|nr:hypothetical protein AMAG_01344 [Allomyces macrogynus ATCC 38327]|eukprot:KNE55452.1 hypothetical protein AMAG_01344 [Allomyces macrogynus ATCC 38327]
MTNALGAGQGTAPAAPAAPALAAQAAQARPADGISPDDMILHLRVRISSNGISVLPPSVERPLVSDIDPAAHAGTAPHTEHLSAIMALIAAATRGPAGSSNSGVPPQVLSALSTRPSGAQMTPTGPPSLPPSLMNRSAAGIPPSPRRRTPSRDRGSRRRTPSRDRSSRRRSPSRDLSSRRRTPSRDRSSRRRSVSHERSRAQSRDRSPPPRSRSRTRSRSRGRGRARENLPAGPEAEAMLDQRWCLSVGNLPFDVHKDEVLRAFSSVGKVAALQFLYRPERNMAFAGWAFLWMANEDGYQRALGMNRTNIGGRSVNVGHRRRTTDFQGSPVRLLIRPPTPDRRRTPSPDTDRYRKRPRHDDGSDMPGTLMTPPTTASAAHSSSGATAAVAAPPSATAAQAPSGAPLTLENLPEGLTRLMVFEEACKTGPVNFVDWGGPDGTVPRYCVVYFRYMDDARRALPKLDQRRVLGAVLRAYLGTPASTPAAAAGVGVPGAAAPMSPVGSANGARMG